MRISDWSSDVCSSDLQIGQCLIDDEGDAADLRPAATALHPRAVARVGQLAAGGGGDAGREFQAAAAQRSAAQHQHAAGSGGFQRCSRGTDSTFLGANVRRRRNRRSEEHTSELQSLMRISYAVFCLKKKTIYTQSYR